MSFDTKPAHGAIDGLQAAYTADMAALQQRIQQLTPNPRVMAGFNASDKPQYDWEMSLFGGTQDPLVVRYYQNPGEPIARPKEFSMRSQDELIYSSKDTTPTVAEYVPFMQGAPKDGRKELVCPHHEPENDFKTTAQQATYKNWFTQARIARDQVGNHNILIALTLMGFTFLPGSHRNPEDWTPPDSDWDILLVDMYFGGSGDQIGRPVTAIPGGYNEIAAFAKKHGKPWGSAETGIGKEVQGAARDAAITAVGAEQRKMGAKYGLWFQKGTGPQVEWLIDKRQAGLYTAALRG